VQMPFVIEEKLDLVSLLQETAIFLWKEWPKNMEVTAVNLQANQVAMRGRCPHCGEPNGFMSVTSIGAVPTGQRMAGLQCQGCLGFILGVFSSQGHNLHYVTHHPLGKPDDKVAPEIPAHIQPDFREALRCRFVDGYNATAEMCRRALEASCIHLGASPKDVLEDMIDELAAKQVITPFMKQVAHKIRLGGNRGAHPSPAAPQSELGIAPPVEVESGPVRIISREHADAIIKFTTEFFHHVYVVPAELAKYDFSKPKI
jgi:hypothetical protein